MVALRATMRAHIAAHILRENVTSDVRVTSDVLRSAQLYACAAAGVGKQGGQPTEVSCSNRSTTLQSKLSARPNFNGKNKPRCAN
jgi:hypothetical protein